VLKIVLQLYPKSMFTSNCIFFRPNADLTLGKKVHDHMSELIDQYFMKHLSLDRAEAYRLHQEYYKTYGLAIEGLVRHHKIDPLEYNCQVDDALPLESIIFPDPQLRKLLQDIDKSKVKLWLLTNAYITHGKRVVRLLDVDDLFEGITYCDYSAERLLCKPHPEMFAKAMREAGVDDVKDCFFVGRILLSVLTMNRDLTNIDDSALNCSKAEELGWTTVHLVEEEETLPRKKACKYQIRNLDELRTLFPGFLNPLEQSTSVNGVNG
jgi:pyrimidine and pyridine-specific 5'-nucleotidase